MSSSETAYIKLLREGVVMATGLGTWSLRIGIEEDHIDYLIGMLLYKHADLRRRMERCGKKTRLRAHFMTRMGKWQRAVRFYRRIKEGDYQIVCARILKEIEQHYEIPLVARGEVPPEGVDDSRDAKLADSPKRKPGRPKLHPVKPTPYDACKACEGRGILGS